MIRRLPIIPTIIVALAVATMIGLGVWQLQRASWKADLLARLEANRTLPPIAYPAVANADRHLYRRAYARCAELVAMRASAGRNVAGTSGWSRIATCNTGIESEITVDIGWSARFDAPVNWRPGSIEGVVAPDSVNVIRLVATTPAPGLEPSQPPGPDSIPNNHRMYAVQWFFFAGVAALIYGLALRRRATTPP